MSEPLTLTAILANFHFLRPEWFYALLPAVLLFLLLKHRQSNISNWDNAVDRDLLPYLIDSPGREVTRSPMTLVLVAWMLAIFALAGPVWEKTQQPVHERENALIVILDLTRSMYATDVKPDRLTRATRKLQDLLNLRKEGVTALVVFAGDAHVVSPLTDDTATINSMIPALNPEIMPASGSQLAPALERALLLFSDAGVTSGRILIMTDEIRDVADALQVARANRLAYPVSVLSVGTTEGAPIPQLQGEPNAGFVKDLMGNLVIPKVDLTALADFASVAGGRFSPMTLTDDDLDYLLAPDPLFNGEDFRSLDRDFDIWFEEGPWLLLLLLPLASLAFRRGWIWILVLCFLPVEQSHALEWADLWQTKDQQGVAALQDGEPERAAQLFEDPEWKGSAQYRNGNYQDAAGHFASIPSGDGMYNLGNAFARQMRLEEAIEAYDESLKLDPDNDDAIFNKELVQKLLEQQQQQQQAQNQQNQEQQQQEGEEQDQEGEQQQDQQQQQQEGEQQEQEQEVAEEESELDREEKQALEQWLRRVPDDPGGLLRRKFEAQYQERLKHGHIARLPRSEDW